MSVVECLHSVWRLTAPCQSTVCKCRTRRQTQLEPSFVLVYTEMLHPRNTSWMNVIDLSDYAYQHGTVNWRIRQSECARTGQLIVAALFYELWPRVFRTSVYIWVISLFFSLSLRLSVSSKFGLKQRTAKKWSRFFRWSQQLAERLAETKLRTERSLNPKLINSPVDFACTR